MRRFLLLLLILSFTLLASCNSKEKEYGENLSQFVEDLISSSSEVEDVVSIYSLMWSKVIDDKIVIETVMKVFNMDRKSVMNVSTANGKKLIVFERSLNYEILAERGDINRAIYITKVVLEDQNKLSPIIESKSDITNRIKELNSPPDKYDKSYEIAFEMYSLYEEFTELALSPSGSLTTYNQKVNELSSEIVKKYKEFEARMPNE